MGTRAEFYYYTGPKIDDPEKIRMINSDHYSWLGWVHYDGYPDSFEKMWKDVKNHKEFIKVVYEMYKELDSPTFSVLDGEEVLEKEGLLNCRFNSDTFIMMDYVYVWFDDLGIYASYFGSHFRKFENYKYGFTGKLEELFDDYH